jgi:hypothetical protein
MLTRAGVTSWRAPQINEVGGRLLVVVNSDGRSDPAIAPPTSTSKV